MYRSWGGSVINMSALPEAKLAREAELSYQVICMATDYDCWHPEHDSVTVDMIVANLTQNARTAQKVIAGAVARAGDRERTCACASALATALITRPEMVPDATKRKLAPIIGKYFK